MQRTTLFLTDAQQRRLARLSRESGKSKSELIRQILDESLGIAPAPMSATEAIESTAGAWADRDAAEVDEVLGWRGELSRARPE